MQNNLDFITDKKQLVLLVDDVVKNLQHAGKVLMDVGYEISVATDGYQALDILKKITPDLILLDIVMPNMDGYEVCRRIKEQTHLKDIPIIFFSSKKESEDIVQGFEIGGVDYIKKPVKKGELVVRVKNHLELKKARDHIMKQNRKLEMLNQSKDEFLEIAAHDLKDPLSSIVGNIEILKTHKLTLTDQEMDEYFDKIDNAARSSVQIISDLLDINALDDGKLKLTIKAVNIDMMIKKKIKEYAAITKKKRITILFRKGAKESLVLGDEEKVEQVLDNLISNAVKYSPFYKAVIIESKSTVPDEKNDKSGLEIAISDEGPGIKEEDIPKLFQRFAKLSNSPEREETSTGLGLSIVKRLIEEMDGKVWCESNKKLSKKGTTFKFTLPTVAVGS